VNVSLSQVPNLHSFNLISLNNDGIRDMAPLKGKFISIVRDLNVYSLLKIDQ